MSAATGPVSSLLETEIARRVRTQRLVLWLDPENHYGVFVDRLARQDGALGYDVCAFRGSYLELLFALSPHTGGVDEPCLLIHLPGHTPDSLKATPLLELALASKPFERDLTDLVTDAATGKVRPEQITAFQSQAAATLEGADTWLQSHLEERSEGFGALVANLGPLAMIEDLCGSESMLATRLERPDDMRLLWDRLAAAIGLSEEWRRRAANQERLATGDLAFAIAGWALAVEYANDLKRNPTSDLLAGTRELPAGIIDTCRQVARALREGKPDFYKRTADETEALLAEEAERAVAEDLGAIDTFRFEERAVLTAALAALGRNAWDSAAEWSELRARGGSFWLKDEPTRLSAWQLVDAAARLGRAIAKAGPTLGRVESLEEAVRRYVEVGAEVDQAHRHLEQRRVALLIPQLPSFETLRICLDAMRALWRNWADAWARDFNHACRTHGFLPTPAFQQRNLFDDVVRPFTQETGLTAYFMVDALRFEMARELVEALGGEETDTTVELGARLAELPSVTAVGMNALAPVASHGRLKPVYKNGAIAGFATGEFRVTLPDDRRRAMHARVGGATCPWLALDDVLNREKHILKNTLKQAQLVVVHSQEIDISGENGAGPAVFDNTLQKLRAAWNLLRDVGVRRFVFTADHGFLLLDERTGAAQVHGRKIDPQWRHTYATVAVEQKDTVRVALEDLHYDPAQGHLVFPETTAVFDRGDRAKDFFHGGNSLQERVIPVMTVVHRGGPKGTVESFALTATREDGVAGMHCIKVTVIGGGGLLDGLVREIELTVRPKNAPGVQVELCQVRGGEARLALGAVMATVSKTFELFFRLTGGTDARVAIEVHHPSKEYAVAPVELEAFFEVEGTRTAPTPATPGNRRDWLEKLPEGGKRQIFEHLAAHGSVTEDEVAVILGSPRAARRFSAEWEALAALVPFGVRTEFVNGVKRYTREGSES